jgi:hypothetical protein
MRKQTLKPADALLWLVLLATTVIMIVGFNGGKSGNYVSVTTLTGTITVGLVEDQTFTVDGRDSYVVVDIKDGSAAIVESPCPRGLCKQQGYISRVGQSVVCMPEGVKLEICDSADTYDTVIH